jgi:hypothetical protein
MRDRAIFTLAAVLAGAALLSACDDDNDNNTAETQQAQCQSTCNAFATCVGSQFDTTTCTSDCANAVAGGTLAQTTVTDCGTCLQSAAANTCSTDCAARCQGVFVTADAGVTPTDASVTPTDASVTHADACVCPDAGRADADP